CSGATLRFCSESTTGRRRAVARRHARRGADAILHTRADDVFSARAASPARSTPGRDVDRGGFRRSRGRRRWIRRSGHGACTRRPLRRQTAALEASMRALEICTLAVMLAVAGCDDAGTSTPTAPATPRSPAPTPAAEPVTASLSGDATLIERTPAATLAWLVEPSGKTTLAAKSAMCEPVGDVKGTLQFVDLASGSEKE